MNSLAQAVIQSEHPGSLGVAIICGVALEEGWSVGVRPTGPKCLRDQSVPPITGCRQTPHTEGSEPIDSGTLRSGEIASDGSTLHHGAADGLGPSDRTHRVAPWIF